MCSICIYGKQGIIWTDEQAYCAWQKDIGRHRNIPEGISQLSMHNSH